VPINLNALQDTRTAVASRDAARRCCRTAQASRPQHVSAQCRSTNQIKNIGSTTRNRCATSQLQRCYEATSTPLTQPRRRLSTASTIAIRLDSASSAYTKRAIWHMIQYHDANYVAIPRDPMLHTPTHLTKTSPARSQDVQHSPDHCASIKAQNCPRGVPGHRPQQAPPSPARHTAPTENARQLTSEKRGCPASTGCFRRVRSRLRTMTLRTSMHITDAHGDHRHRTAPSSKHATPRRPQNTQTHTQLALLITHPRAAMLPSVDGMLPEN
jgi:hypothetical protein